MPLERIPVDVLAELYVLGLTWGGDRVDEWPAPQIGAFTMVWLPHARGMTPILWDCEGSADSSDGLPEWSIAVSYEDGERPPSVYKCERRGPWGIYRAVAAEPGLMVTAAWVDRQGSRLCTWRVNDIGVADNPRYAGIEFKLVAFIDDQLPEYIPGR